MDFWEKLFQSIGTNWGYKPASSAVKTSLLFSQRKIKNVLIPGIGYGRNVTPFTKKGILVSGIEISKTAVALAQRKSIPLLKKIYNRSVLDMPFEKKLYDGLYCYSLLHLFNKRERMKIIQNCYSQLSKNGLMVFVVLSKESSLYGTGKYLSADRYELQKGLNVYFYNLKSAEAEFKNFGLVKAYAYTEQIKHNLEIIPLNCIYILCEKKPLITKSLPWG